MAYASANLELLEGDFNYMGKLNVTHVSGNLKTLDFDINADTQIVFHKETTRQGKRYSYKYGLSLKNPNAENSLSIDLATKPGKGIIFGALRASEWGFRRNTSRNEYCTVEFGKNSAEIIFFKEEHFEGKKLKINCRDEMLKDQGAVFEAIKYLKLDARRVNETFRIKSKLITI